MLPLRNIKTETTYQINIAAYMLFGVRFNGITLPVDAQDGFSKEQAVLPGLAVGKHTSTILQALIREGFFFFSRRLKQCACGSAAAAAVPHSA